MPQAKIFMKGPAADAAAMKAAVDSVADRLSATMRNVTAPWSSEAGTGRIIITMPCDTQEEADAFDAVVRPLTPEGWTCAMDFQADFAAGVRAAWAAQTAAEMAAKYALENAELKRIANARKDADRPLIEKVLTSLDDDTVLDKAAKDRVTAILAETTGIGLVK